MIIVYSKMACAFCERAKYLLGQKGEDWKEIRIGKDIDIDEFKELFPDARTVPQIVEMTESGAKKIGGYDDLVNWYTAKEMSI